MKKILCKAVANQGGAMGADTISKNGRSSKSQMSRKSIISFTILAIITGFYYHSCSSDEVEKYLRVDQTSVNFCEEGYAQRWSQKSHSVEVITNLNLNHNEVSISSSRVWCTVTRPIQDWRGWYINIDVAENTATNPRQATITISSRGLQATIEVFQEGAPPPPPTGGTETGLYMGIIGFHESLTETPISLLNNNNRSQFQNFVSGLTMGPSTGLYYAVDNAINRLQAATLPNYLVNVAIVTFTDGLDNISTALNTNYSTRDAYRDAIQNRIRTTRIKNQPITAYSIGVRGTDVADIDAFRAGLAAMASNAENVREVTNMTEVNNTFAQIAASLTNVNQSQSIVIRVPDGYDDGSRLRFTFDNVNATTVANSTLYVEGIYRKSGTTRSLQNVVYHGLSSSSGTTVTGTLASLRGVFTFENTSTVSGSNVPTNNVQAWEWRVTPQIWQRDSEFGREGDVETITERKSAVIMLVLDCTTSLGNTDFNSMKNAANNFITTLTR